MTGRIHNQNASIAAAMRATTGYAVLCQIGRDIHTVYQLGRKVFAGIRKIGSRSEEQLEKVGINVLVFHQKPMILMASESFLPRL